MLCCSTRSSPVVRGGAALHRGPPRCCPAPSCKCANCAPHALPSPAPAGELEKRSLHTACPVIKGEKWSAPKCGSLPACARLPARLPAYLPPSLSLLPPSPPTQHTKNTPCHLCYLHRWIHVGHFATGNETPVAVQQTVHTWGPTGPCEDADANCQGWAASGECDKNPQFMVGTRANPGSCIKACGRCNDIFSGTEAAQA